MAAVARETGVPDTGFVIREELADADFRIRWFTPTVEIDLCGHATLASAHCLLEDGVQGPIRFASRSGVLTISQLADGSLAMDFPSWPATQIEAPSPVAEAVGVPVEWTGYDAKEFFLLALASDEASVRALTPDLNAVASLDASALIVTAVADPGQDRLRLRLFAPGSRHPGGSGNRIRTFGARAVLGRPPWTDIARGLQVSPRSGLVGVQLNGDRVTSLGTRSPSSTATLSPAANPR